MDRPIKLKRLQKNRAHPAKTYSFFDLVNRYVQPFSCCFVPIGEFLDLFSCIENVLRAIFVTMHTKTISFMNNANISVTSYKNPNARLVK